MRAGAKSVFAGTLGELLARVKAFMLSPGATRKHLPSLFPGHIPVQVWARSYFTNESKVISGALSEGELALSSDTSRTSNVKVELANTKGGMLLLTSPRAKPLL